MGRWPVAAWIAVSAAADLALELLRRVQVQPRLVLVRVIAHLVPGRHERAQRRHVLLPRGVHAHDEERDA